VGSRALRLAITGGVIAVGSMLGLREPAQAVTSACDAIAANLVKNCGFETGDFTSWTPSETPSAVFGVNTADPHTGSLAAFFANSSTDSISQSIPTSAGGAYNVTFWLANDLDVNIFDATFGMTSLESFVDVSPFAYTAFSTTVEATSSATELVFTGLGTRDTLFLDDVSVVPVAVATPEPASLALLAVGLAGLGMALRLRRA